MDIQVPLLAAKALILLLLFAFVYSVVRRGVGDLRSVPEENPKPAKRPSGSRRNGYGNHGNYEDYQDAPPAYQARASGLSELVVENSEVMAPETRFPLMRGNTDLGRSSGSDIVLKSDDYASGRHARLTRHGGLLYVEDTGSTNGTFVNGRKTVGATPLKAGDKLRIGSTIFRYEE